jgi:hypothetical protein
MKEIQERNQRICRHWTFEHEPVVKRGETGGGGVYPTTHYKPNSLIIHVQKFNDDFGISVVLEQRVYVLYID